MVILEIQGISGGTLPISLYACDVYQNQCVLFGTIESSVPPTVTFTLPSQFDTVPSFGILLVDDDGCEKFEIAVCNVGDVYAKIFQNDDENHIFQFMDYVIYRFEGP